MRRITVLIFFCFCLLTACKNTNSDSGAGKKTEISNASVAGALTAFFHKQKTGASDSELPACIDRDTLVAASEVYRIYSLFKFQPIWTDMGRLNPLGDSLYRLIKGCSNSGLIPRDYYLGELDSLFRTSEKRNTPFWAFSRREDFMKKEGRILGGGEVSSVLRVELLMTDGLFKLAVHLNQGRLDQDSLRSVWKIKQVGGDLVSILGYAIRQNKLEASLDSLEPHSDQYRLLKDALNKFRTEFEKSEWDSLPPIEKDTVTFYKLLAGRLQSSHFLDSVSTEKIIDKILQRSDKALIPELEKMLAPGLKKFQLQHGLNDDGKTGKFTYAALNVSKQEQIRALEMNMERWRWESNPGKRYLWVNIPSFQLKVLNDDTVYTEAKVITGNPTHPSPVLKSLITYFIIYPYWNVPYKIASEEILPRIKWDTAYLRLNHFDVLDWNNKVTDPSAINWSKYNKTNLPYKFRQQDGEDNSLGVIKFMFSNPFGVYLHDTNSKRLFGKEVRALSHGCIRMQNPWVLADFLIKEDKHLTTDSLFTYYEKEERKTIALRKPLPVYIRYFTCEVEAKDKLYFYTDIYGKDQQMIRAIY